MSAWSVEELERMGASHELQIAPRRPDASLHRPLPVWVVRVGDELYVRSWRGAGGDWYCAARASRGAHISAGGVEKDVALEDVGEEMGDPVDAAYREKYGRHSGYIETMIAAPARATTLRLVPEDGA